MFPDTEYYQRLNKLKSKLNHTIYIHKDGTTLTIHTNITKINIISHSLQNHIFVIMSKRNQVSGLEWNNIIEINGNKVEI